MLGAGVGVEFFSPTGSMQNRFYSQFVFLLVMYIKILDILMCCHFPGTESETIDFRWM